MGDSIHCTLSVFLHIKLMPLFIKLSNWKQYFAFLLIKGFIINLRQHNNDDK